MKTRRRKTASPKRRTPPKALRSRLPSVAELQKQIASLTRELREAREQQIASSEVLQVISTSPGELESVFKTLLANATTLCEASVLALTEDSQITKMVRVCGHEDAGMHLAVS